MGENRLRRALNRLVATDDQVGSQELERRGLREGADKVVACGQGQHVCLSGEVRSVRLDTRGGSPVLEAELYDGTGVVALVFLGRRKLAGMTAGRGLTVRGRLTTTEGRATMFNPSYELLASGTSGS